ncbi:ribosome hibernation promoting factor HPF [Rugosibacter aromaticivorans]|uniref:Ribosome hibernation promoting factor n=1 Tax=Rugosibacter aromaticivorans TaxID=1565605 RepID=A0A0C5J623_9PROT|nr:ribosome-associated translation inhibitor RaiA [Rugosibacter aromaticivorans]AJP47445.1 ribosome hibernation promoting factor HPF [Rugosibacter aromaticivorans]TBR15678.1 MAG: ribosome-associated translation inhibitor RaiA [Rugosibacter sp.]
MNLNLTGHHVEITPALREHVTLKLDRVIRHFDHITSTHVILSVDKLQQKAEVTLHVKGKDIYADSTDTDLYVAIDQLADKLDRQIVKHKEKASTRHRDKQLDVDNP